MIELHKLSGDLFYLNEDQIETIRFIPETKIILMNKEFYIVKDSGEEVIDRIIEFRRKILQPATERYLEGEEGLQRRN